jgi:4-hydroxy-3-methylbut-2-enyl diphosphate reductase
MNVLAPKPPLKVLLASPRGFCAGVDRAIQIVEKAIEKYGAPVYVRHEIVHNKFVVDDLKAKGAIFVEEVEEAPADRPIVFSAHGVPKSVPIEARERKMLFLDATCPLVSKVHVEAQRHYRNGRQIVLIGHMGHPEVIGTMGQLPEGAVTLIENVEDVERFNPIDPDNVAFVTQTTLSVDDTADIVAALQARFPGIATPHKEDICYATTNRQDAVKAIADACDLMLVVGSPTSSNSVRLVETGRRRGVANGYLIDSAEDMHDEWLDGVKTLGLTAGASAPEILVQGVLDRLRQRFELTIEEVAPTRETVTFKLPRVLTA